MNGPHDEATRAAIERLVELGLTDLEARVYSDLLLESGSTGYRVAQRLGKPAANVYKALESLESKGAVTAEEGASRRFRPLPADDFLELLARRFARRREAASEALASLPGPREDERVYTLRAAEDVLDRARLMISGARGLVLLDVFPGPFEELRTELEGAVERGVEVVAKVYAPAELEGARLVGEPAAEVRSGILGSWIAAYVDGSEFLYGLLSHDLGSVVHAVWSRSPDLSSVLTFGFAFELAYTSIKAEFARGADLETLRQCFEANETYFAERIRPLAVERRWLDPRHEETKS